MTTLAIIALVQEGLKAGKIAYEWYRDEFGTWLDRRMTPEEEALYVSQLREEDKQPYMKAEGE